MKPILRFSTFHDAWRFGIGFYHNPIPRDWDYDTYGSAIGIATLELYFGPWTLELGAEWEHE